MIGCNTASLQPYRPVETKPWNRLRAQHLFRRVGFSASVEELQSALEKDPLQLIDELMKEAIRQDPITPPEWAEYTLFDFEPDTQIDLFLEWRSQWIQELYNKSFRDKMALFWHNHFVTQFGVYLCAPSGYKYLRSLQTHALGNFKDFVREIGLESSMLIYLNGTQNTKQEPNENYARELYELFTLGRDNGYSQEDIRETARALTGYVVFPCPEVNFIAALWDSGEKTIFGRTGNWGYDDVIDILFEERGELIAHFICEKLYHHFVYPTATDEQIIQSMAATMIASDFEIAPVVKELLQSEHFFDESVIGVKIKNPIELSLNIWKEFGFDMQEEALQPLISVTDFLGQILFQPPNVAGWVGHRSWITAAFLRSRWQVATLFVGLIFENDQEKFRNIAKQLTNDSNDPDLIVRSLVDHFIPNGFASRASYDRASVAFKIGIPEGYFERGDWNLDWDEAPFQVASLFIYLIRQPEFQLF